MLHSQLAAMVCLVMMVELVALEEQVAKAKQNNKNYCMLSMELVLEVTSKYLQQRSFGLTLES